MGQKERLRSCACARLIPTGLPEPSSTNSTVGSLRSAGLPSRPISNSVTPDELTTCSGGIPSERSAKTRNELDAAVRDDEGLEAVRTEVAEQLQLRLADEACRGSRTGWRVVASHSCAVLA